MRTAWPRRNARDFSRGDTLSEILTPLAKRSFHRLNQYRTSGRLPSCPGPAFAALRATGHRANHPFLSKHGSDHLLPQHLASQCKSPGPGLSSGSAGRAWTLPGWGLHHRAEPNCLRTHARASSAPAIRPSSRSSSTLSIISRKIGPGENPISIKCLPARRGAFGGPAARRAS